MRRKSAPTRFTRTTGMVATMSEVAGEASGETSGEACVGVMHDVRHVRADAAWSLGRGASIIDDGVRFEVWAPHADRMSVEVWNGARIVELPLQPIAAGVFAGFAPDVHAGADYRYRVTVGGRTLERPDPVSRHQPYGVHGSSRVVDPNAFRWTDDGWSPGPMADQVVYELHVGTFTPAGTFDAVAERLGGLRYLGVTAIEIMPVAEFPGDRNWGYDGVDLYAPESSYGGPDGLKRLV